MTERQFTILVDLILGRARWLREYSRGRFNHIDRELALIKAGLVGSDPAIQKTIDDLTAELNAASDSLDAVQK